MTSTIAYKNFVANTIKTLVKTNEQKQKKLDYIIGNGASNDTFTIMQVSKLQNDITYNDCKIREFQTFQTDLEKGEICNELKEEYDAVNKTIAQAPKKVKTQPTKKEVYKYNNNVQTRPINYNREFSYFQNQSNRLPQHIRNNLNNMPTNKGYIYNNVWHYGKKPDENNNTIVLFEKRDKDNLLIHEITKDHHKISSKPADKTKRQKVISITPRRKIAAF